MVGVFFPDIGVFGLEALGVLDLAGVFLVDVGDEGWDFELYSALGVLALTPLRTALVVLGRRGEPAAIADNGPEKDFERVGIVCQRCSGGLDGSGSLPNPLVLL